MAPPTIAPPIMAPSNTATPLENTSAQATCIISGKWSGIVIMQFPF